MVYILLASGFEEIEAITPCDLLRRAGVDAKFVCVGGKRIDGSHGFVVEADLSLEEASETLPEMIVLPGGRRGVESLLASEPALRLIQDTWADGRYAAAICAAPTVLAKLGIVSDQCATCYPGLENQMGEAKMQPEAVVTDGRLTTGRSAGCSMQFGLRLIAVLCGAEAAKKVADGVVYRCPDGLL